MSEHPISMYSSGPPRTVLPAEAAELNDALQKAFSASPDDRRPLVARVVVANPRSLNAWAALGS
ncbi:MAG: hypothetical protein ABI862_20220, partial [Ilumatobacteraceae bacterium]